MKKIIVGILIVLIAIMLIGGKSKCETVAYKSYTVKQGDTLYGIARKITPESKDYRYAVYDIIEKNSITDCMIYQGQTILVPVMEGEE